MDWKHRGQKQASSHWTCSKPTWGGNARRSLHPLEKDGGKAKTRRYWGLRWIPQGYQDSKSNVRVLEREDTEQKNKKAGWTIRFRWRRLGRTSRRHGNESLARRHTRRGPSTQHYQRPGWTRNLQTRRAIPNRVLQPRANGEADTEVLHVQKRRSVLACLKAKGSFPCL